MSAHDHTPGDEISGKATVARWQEFIVSPTDLNEQLARNRFTVSGFAPTSNPSALLRKQILPSATFMSALCQKRTSRDAACA
jgi:hypothetical protein